MIPMKRAGFFGILLLLILPLFSQSEEDKIIEALQGYMVGTSYHYPDSVLSAFMPKANMFLENREKELFLMKIEDYAGRIDRSKAGEFNGRVSYILDIDRFGLIATAKLEVLIPAIEKRFIDYLLLRKLEGEWKIISKTATSETSVRQGKKALLIVSSACKQGKSDLPAGNSFSEVMLAYHGYQQAGYHVDILSPKGGKVPLAYINPADSLHLAYLYDKEFMYRMANTLPPNKIRSSEYDIVQFTGGSAPIFDIPENKAIQEIAMSIYEEHNGVIAAVCHGTAGIVNLKTEDGKYLIEGKNVNGVPDAQENKSLAHYQHYPFIIETVMKERGGIFKHSDIRDPHMEVAGRLITGQNSVSTEMVTKKSIEVSEALKEEAP
ncbi:MAG: nuclear transport factor 2 family protein [Bacteroidota bacterium]